jgi:hypothetical protein
VSIPVTLTGVALAQAGLRKGLALFFPSSTTYTIPASGWYRLSALGAGGSGAASFKSTTAPSASGGGGGGFAESEVYLTKDTVLTITVGAGGASVASSVDGTGAAGNGGGSTIIQFGSTTIFAAAAALERSRT